MAKGEDKEDGQATEGSAPPSPAKKPWHKPSMWEADGVLYTMNGRNTYNTENTEYHASS